MTRLSVAIRPPADVLALLARLPRVPTPGVTWSTPEQWLVKLRPLGHVDERLVAPPYRDVVLARGQVPAALAGDPVTARWVATTVVLVADRSAPGRPRFLDLAEFGLGTG